MSARPEAVAENWDRVADLYDANIAPIMRQFADETLRLLPPDAKGHALDVAAGSGALTLRLAPKTGKVTAIDFSQRLVEHLQRKAEAEGIGNLDVRVMDGMGLTFPDDSFDAAYSLFGAFLFANRIQGFMEMRRVVRPGGGLAVSTWDAPPHNEWMGTFGAALQQAFPEMEAPPPPPFMEVADPGRLRAEVEEAGWSDVRIQTVAGAPEWPDGEAAWRAIARSNPVFPAIVEQLGDAGAKRFHDAFLDEIAAKCGDGPVRLPTRAHIALGRA